jgi:drug/metabolite transporter (DMT)-like permease
MKPIDIIMLFLLASLWGSSFLFMRIGVPALGPFVLIFLRVSIAGLALVLYAFAARHRLNLLRKWKEYLVLGAFNAAIPFSLISAAELHVSSSLAAILNATTPLFTALVAWVWTKDTLTFKKMGGLLLGLLGVTILVGWDPYQNGEPLFKSVMYSLFAAFSYGIGGVYSSRAFSGEKPMDMAIGQQAGASLFLVPFAVATLPHEMPSLTVMFSVLGLAILCTSLGYLLFFALMRNVGPIKTLSVTFLVPVFGVLWGALFLREAITVNIISGLVIILLSVALVADLPFLRRKREWKENASSSR